MSSQALSDVFYGGIFASSLLSLFLLLISSDLLYSCLYTRLYYSVKRGRRRLRCLARHGTLAATPCHRGEGGDDFTMPTPISRYLDVWSTERRLVDEYLVAFFCDAGAVSTAATLLFSDADAAVQCLRVVCAAAFMHNAGCGQSAAAQRRACGCLPDFHGWAAADDMPGIFPRMVAAPSGLQRVAPLRYPRSIAACELVVVAVVLRGSVRPLSPGCFFALHNGAALLRVQRYGVVAYSHLCRPLAFALCHYLFTGMTAGGRTSFCADYPRLCLRQLNSSPLPRPWCVLFIFSLQHHGALYPFSVSTILSTERDVGEKGDAAGIASRWLDGGRLR